MTIVIYIIAALFVVLCISLIFGYRRTQHAGLLLMSIVYGTSAALALWTVHWWPLAAGFALVWVMRLLGMEPLISKDEGGRIMDESSGGTNDRNRT